MFREVGPEPRVRGRCRPSPSQRGSVLRPATALAAVGIGRDGTKKCGCRCVKKYGVLRDGRGWVLRGSAHTTIGASCHITQRCPVSFGKVYSQQALPAHTHKRPGTTFKRAGQFRGPRKLSSF
eukprot:gene15547-biopygen21721